MGGELDIKKELRKILYEKLLDSYSSSTMMIYINEYVMGGN